MRKIISFVVYGKSEIYNYGLYENAMLLPQIFPGWKMVVNYTPTANTQVINALKKLPWVELELYDLPNHHKNTMLRFIPAFESRNDVVIFRDADSRLIKRDFIAVDDWLRHSRKDVHIMRDHPVSASLIMAGLWGVRNRILCQPEIILQFWKYFNDPEFKAWSVDQKYLAKYIYPLVVNKARIHAEYNAKDNEKEATKFPRSAPSRNKEYCGMTFHRLPYSVEKFGIEDRNYYKTRN